VDFSKRFLPESLTPLFYAPIYRELSEAQRLRYNQLHACYILEQTIFFESAMAQHILARAAKQPLPEGWAEGLRLFIAEEKRHSQMFRELNRKCLPQHYAKGDFYFIHLNPGLATLLDFWVKHSGWFPLFLWLLLIEEERSLFYSKEFLRHSLELEPEFLAVQKAHLADEIGHIGWDEKLLDLIWPTTCAWQRRMNASVFTWLMGEYFNTPKRAGLRVVQELVTEFPSLQPGLEEMETQILSLSRDAEYHRSLYSREITPKTFARFDVWEEFRGIEAVLLGYTPAR
jgi:hypothetical protein